jgi:general secretion pathway protein G
MKLFRGQANVPPRRGHGFTTTEIVVSLLVGAVLLVSVGTRMDERPRTTVSDEIRQDIRVISEALQQYRVDNQVFPTSEQGLGALVERPGSLPLAPNWRSEGYLEELPLDPWGHHYRYLYPGLNGEFDVYSLGADHAPGGEGDAADVGNWAG